MIFNQGGEGVFRDQHSDVNVDDERAALTLQNIRLSGWRGRL